MRELTDLALDIARDAGADFADMRIVDLRETTVFVQRRSLKLIEEGESLGFGVRALIDGAWGYASSTDLSRAGVEETARLAADMARASARVPKAVPARMAPGRYVWCITSKDEAGNRSKQTCRRLTVLARR